MWWIYLDESGDLGFDFVNKKPSRFFTVCLLVIDDGKTHNQIKKAIRKTLKRKLNKPKKNRILELKGTHTTIGIKEYFFKFIANENFSLYAITLNKRRVYESLTKDKERVYNWIARLILDKIPFEKAKQRVQLVLDRSKGRIEIVEFNRYWSYPDFVDTRIRR